jgi:hypothetical protein
MNGGINNGKVRWLQWASQNSAVALTAMGLVIYAVVRVGIDAFYSEFGVTAEDVGLSQTLIIARSALALATTLVTLRVPSP